MFGVSIYKQRDIALVPFPFSDLSGQKLRPVLILSNDRYNQQSADVLVCGLTSIIRQTPYSITVDVTDVEQSGTLRHKSRVKADADCIFGANATRQTDCSFETFSFQTSGRKNQGVNQITVTFYYHAKELDNEKCNMQGTWF